MQAVKLLHKILHFLTGGSGWTPYVYGVRQIPASGLIHFCSDNVLPLVVANHCLFVCPNVSNSCRGHISVVVALSDGELYSATVADISSRDALIYKKPIRSEQHDSQWLNGTFQQCCFIFKFIIQFVIL